jgi:transposase-like protein
MPPWRVQTSIQRRTLTEKKWTALRLQSATRHVSSVRVRASSRIFSHKWGESLRHSHTLLAFYDFPAEHWDHLRTTNPIESVFATVRHRTGAHRGLVVADHCQG